MKYTPELTQQITDLYNEGKSAAEIAELVNQPERSIISKLASLGVYKKKGYLTKRGETPVKKAEYIEQIAELLDMDVELLESLEKVNKSILVILVDKLTPAVTE